ncbi:hypothetical protein D9619_009218 [Psilocybe cf. subviscida]|uniref:Protein kinase domain-containing protein n=1 Tax=Psilocybe cf. subviscida TaxID=2480587 RepID=A0A8H5FA46_9AGAR|nr:hypothetical protein D9619_009218 [Psilocybe cf. subviscida]
MSKKPAVPPTYPPLGSFIDDNTLELVEVLRFEGYGVVYRAEAYFAPQRSCSVKCLRSARGQSVKWRQLLLREIALHQMASKHPAVVTLDRVVEEGGFTFIIMDFAADDNLFTQTLHKTHYLGNDTLIKLVFLQLLDAVQYCHSLGIYHQDLRPKNVLCYDRGYRIALTNFGLATTDKYSTELRTGSVYYVGPECQAGGSERPEPYSPMQSDIWSLGIILLNLVTARNPWKSATPDDAAYQAYLRDPSHFLPSALPISDELNNVLVRVLAINWKTRIPLPELRVCIKNIKNLYSKDVIFESDLARCPWEEGLDLGHGAHHAVQAQQPAPTPEKRPVPDIPEGVEPSCVLSITSRTPSPLSSFRNFNPVAARLAQSSVISSTSSCSSATTDYGSCFRPRELSSQSSIHTVIGRN